MADVRNQANQANQAPAPARPGVQQVAGISWPADAKGKVSTTHVAKEIWHATAVVAGQPTLAKGIQDEGNWRFKYPTHLAELTEALGALEPDACKNACLRGLKVAREHMLLTTFDGSTMSVEAASQLPVCHVHRLCLLATPMLLRWPRRDRRLPRVFLRSMT